MGLESALTYKIYATKKQVEGRPRRLSNYVTPDNIEPFREWIRKLKNYEGRGRILVRLNRIREHGNLGKCKALKDGVFELIIDAGPGYRVYFAEDGERDEIVLLCGGDKSTQKADVVRAKKYWSEYNA